MISLSRQIVILIAALASLAIALIILVPPFPKIAAEPENTTSETAPSDTTITITTDSNDTTTTNDAIKDAAKTLTDSLVDSEKARISSSNDNSNSGNGNNDNRRNNEDLTPMEELINHITRGCIYVNQTDITSVFNSGIDHLILIRCLE